MIEKGGFRSSLFDGIFLPPSSHRQSDRIIHSCAISGGVWYEGVGQEKVSWKLFTVQVVVVALHPAFEKRLFQRPYPNLLLLSRRPKETLLRLQC